ncbi:MAG TPA: hypothetical protein PLC48_14995 [Ferruginibacter sp.]|nr:hypothetical protein [Ferruginibacter sp.]
MKIISICFLILISGIMFISCYKEVKVPVVIDFTVSKLDNNNTVPVKISIENKTTGATTYNWTFEGAEPASSNKKNPGTISFSTGGRHSIVLEASNDEFKESKEFIIDLDSAVTIDFSDSILINHFSPVTVRLTNHTIGGSTFNWTFDGGTPASSTLQNPADVVFTGVGDHAITLSVGNGSNVYTLTKTITVAPALSAGFDIVPSFQDEDYEAPLVAQLNNTTVSGVNWQWACSGATISDPSAENPSIYFPTAGNYMVTLTADNNKETQVVNHTINVLPNKNLRTHTDIKFGINAAHATIGSFYSTKLRRSFTSSDNLDTAGAYIDIAFFGINQLFEYNKFISPDSAQYYAFDQIPNAQSVKFINSAELCGCGLNFSATDFDNMTTDLPLQPLNITPAGGSWHQFLSTPINRVVLFVTADGRRGAIKIKQFVSAGAGSYIMTDIKIQKNF